MKLKSNLIAIFISTLISSITYAGNGKAIIPLWGAGTNFSTVIDVSNITDNPLYITFTVYGSAGNVISSTYLSYGNINSSTGEIAANNTGFLQISGLPSNDYGYAIVTWKNKSGDDAIGLVAQGLRIYSDSSVRSEYAIPINNGMPF